MALTDQPLYTLATSDNNAQVGTVSIRVTAVTDYTTAQTAITATLMALVNGTKKEEGVYDRALDSNRLIGAPASDKSHTWKVVFRDNVTGRLASVKIPTANPLLRLTGSDALDPALTVYTDLVTNVNTYWKHPVTGNAVTFESCTYE
jgi:hypothetical protein